MGRGLAALALGLAVGCSQGPSGPTPSAVPLAGLAAHPRGTPSANAIVSWVIAAADACPSLATLPVTVPINIRAANAAGSLLGGSFATPITLVDSDKTGATRLSIATVSSASQENLTLTFSKRPVVYPVRITSQLSGTTAPAGVASIYPNGKCVNATPDIIVAGGHTPATLALSGQPAAPPYRLGSASTGESQACGSKVSIGASGTAFTVTSEIEYVDSCLVFGTADNGNTISGVGVLLLK
jgi:hypothetical protein